MSLARAFTTRRSSDKNPPNVPPQTAQKKITTKQHSASPGAIVRSKISAPVELVSTTNMLSYNAPDLHPGGSTSSQSGDDSDRNASRSSTPPTSPDRSSLEDSPAAPQPNHLSCYFRVQGVDQAREEVPVPVIPQRALTRTKKSSRSLSSKRSIAKISLPDSSTATRSSGNMSSPTHAENRAAAKHPFGNELAQVSEVAEEFGVRERVAQHRKVVGAEEQELISRGLMKFCAEDYMSELQGLFRYAFEEERSRQNVWI